MPVRLEMVFVLAAAAGAGLHGAQDLNLDLGAGVKLELVRIPAGDFQMGETHLNRSSIGFFAPHELIARRIQITKPYYIGRYEVTVAQFRQFVGTTGYSTDAESGNRPWRGLRTGCYTVAGNAWGKNEDASWKTPGFPQDENHPVTCVSWNDAAAFCRWISERTRRNCRLPTEAELEYAQRAATETRYYWGVRPDPKSLYANVSDDAAFADEDVFLEGQPEMKHWIPKGRNDGFRYTTPVGYFQPNLFGLYDASGNVWEYTLDWAGPDPAGADPRGADSTAVRGMRGGSWMSSPDFFRPSFRAEVEPEGRTGARGIRVLIEEQP